MTAAYGLDNRNGARDRPPPHFGEAERATLGAMMRDNSTIPDVRRIVRADDFYFDAHQKIFRGIEHVHDAGSPVDSVILGDYLDSRNQLADVGGRPYLIELYESAPTAANASYYAGNVRERGVRRALIHLTAEVNRDARDGTAPAEELVERAGRLLALLEGAGARRLASWAPQPATLADMARADYRHRWLVRLLLVLGEPGIIFGPSKILKTSFVVDLCLMLAVGGLVLGEFRAEQKARWCPLSVESYGGLGASNWQSLLILR